MLRTFSFILGGIAGAYVAQNYNIPNVRDSADWLYTKAREMEHNYKKNKLQQNRIQCCHQTQQQQQQQQQQQSNSGSLSFSSSH